MDLLIVRKVVIGGALEGGWYSSHEMDRLGSLREYNRERISFRCAASMFGLGVKSITTEREAFRMILAALSVVKTRSECIWMIKECGGMMGLEFEALRLKIVVK